MPNPASSGSIGWPFAGTKRVLFLVPRFHTNQLGWIDRLRAAGVEVSMVVRKFGRIESHRDVEVRYRPMLNQTGLLAAISQYRELRRVVIDFRPTHIVLRLERKQWFVLGLVASVFSNARVMIYTQTPQMASKRRPAYRVVLQALHTTRKVTAMTPVHHRMDDPEWMTSNPLPHSRYVPFLPPLRNDIVDSVSRDEASISGKSSSLSLLAVGAFRPRKQHKELAGKLAKVADGVDFFLTITGASSEPAHEVYRMELEDLVQELDLSERVRILENVEPPQLQSLLKDSDLLLLVSRDEPASVTQVEALGLGTPAIVCRTNGTAHYVRHGETGFLVSEQLTELPDIIRRLSTNRAELAELKQAALDHADGLLDSKSFCEEFLINEEGQSSVSVDT